MGKICEGWGYGFEDYLKFTFVALKVFLVYIINLFRCKKFLYAK